LIGALLINKEGVMAKWVQHVSGQGEKWKVMNEESDYEWVVRSKIRHDDVHYLPMTEYVESEPPEKWVDAKIRIDRHEMAVESCVNFYLPLTHVFERVSENTFKILKKVVDN
jgi:hypothetical protein